MTARIEELEAQLAAAQQYAPVPVPDWESAPTWANWWTRDVSGITMWWQTKPSYDGRIGAWMCEDDSLRVRGTDLAVLRERPAAQTKQGEE